MSNPKADTAKRLLNLADPSKNDKENERRNAAVALVKLILERGLVICDPTDAPRKEPPRQQPRPQSAFRIIVSKYDSWCRVCHEQIDQGQQCAWARGCGCTHVECANQHDWTEGDR